MACLGGPLGRFLSKRPGALPLRTCFLTSGAWVSSRPGLEVGGYPQQDPVLPKSPHVDIPPTPHPPCLPYNVCSGSLLQPCSALHSPWGHCFSASPTGPPRSHLGLLSADS